MGGGGAAAAAGAAGRRLPRRPVVCATRYRRLRLATGRARTMDKMNKLRADVRALWAVNLLAQPVVNIRRGRPQLWARGRRDHLTRECRTRLCVITTNVVVCMHAEPVECGERWRETAHERLGQSPSVTYVKYSSFSTSLPRCHALATQRPTQAVQRG